MDAQSAQTDETARSVESVRTRSGKGVLKRSLPEAMAARKWKPGQSGNPGGRPRKITVLSAWKALMQEDDEDEPTKTKAEVLADRLYAAGKAGDIGAIKLGVEHHTGKATQNINVSTGPVVRVYDVSCAPELALEDSSQDAPNSLDQAV